MKIKGLLLLLSILPLGSIAQTLCNGISLPKVWPPRYEEPTVAKEMDVPYLEGVSKCTHPLFYAQSPDFLKPGLCYFLKFLYL